MPELGPDHQQELAGRFQDGSRRGRVDHLLHAMDTGLRMPATKSMVERRGAVGNVSVASVGAAKVCATSTQRPQEAAQGYVPVRSIATAVK